MKKLISSTLALTMLATPLISSTCFAAKGENATVRCVQSEKRSKKSELKDLKSKDASIKRTLVGIAVGAIALTAGIVATLKKEDKLSENLKAKLPSLLPKETQESNETIRAEVEKDIRSLIANSTTSAITDNITNNITDTKNATSTNSTNGVSDIENSVSNFTRNLMIGGGGASLFGAILLAVFCYKKNAVLPKGSPKGSPKVPTINL